MDALGCDREVALTTWDTFIGLSRSASTMASLEGSEKPRKSFALTDILCEFRFGVDMVRRLYKIRLI